MDCAEVRELLIDDLDGTLPRERAALVARHILACAACREEREALCEAEAAARSLPRVAAPADFLARLHERLDRPEDAAAPARAAGPGAAGGSHAGRPGGDGAAPIRLAVRRARGVPRGLMALAATILIAVGISLVSVSTQRLETPRVADVAKSATGATARGEAAQVAAERAARERSLDGREPAAPEIGPALDEKATQRAVAEALARAAPPPAAVRSETVIADRVGEAAKQVTPASEEAFSLVIESSDVSLARTQVIAALAQNGVTPEEPPAEDAPGERPGKAGGAPGSTLLYAEVTPSQYAAIEGQLALAGGIRFRATAAAGGGYTFQADGDEEPKDARGALEGEGGAAVKPEAERKARAGARRDDLEAKLHAAAADAAKRKESEEALRKAEGAAPTPAAPGTSARAAVDGTGADTPARAAAPAVPAPAEPAPLPPARAPQATRGLPGEGRGEGPRPASGDDGPARFLGPGQAAQSGEAEHARAGALPLAITQTAGPERPMRLVIRIAPLERAREAEAEKRTAGRREGPAAEPESAPAPATKK